VGEEGFSDLVTNLERCLGNGRAKPDQQIRRFDVQFRNGVLDDTGRKTAPPGMRSTKGLTIPRAHKQRQTIGRADSTQKGIRALYGRIRLWCHVEMTGCDHVRAVDLIEMTGFAWQRSGVR
jgi:hypothetical protein